MIDHLVVGAIVRVPSENIGEAGVDEIFDEETALIFSAGHPVAPRCDRFIGRDAGDNLFVIRGSTFYYWDHETDELFVLGDDPSQFIDRIEQ